MLLFRRKYELILVGLEDSRVIDKLRISFEVKKSMRSYPNLAIIKIFNLSQDSINYIQREQPLILLRAGYEEEIKLIFRGRIRNSFVDHKGLDRVVTLYAGDGERDWQEAKFNESYIGKISLIPVIEDIFSSFNISGDVTPGPIIDIDDEASYLHGNTLSGSSKDVLDDLGESHNFQWAIYDGEISAVGGDSILNKTSTIPIIDQTSGMIGSPTITEIGADVDSLLNPSLLPGRAFRIKSDSQDISISNLQFRKVRRTVATGLYRAFETIFMGDTHGASWTTKAKGSFLNE